MATRMAEDIPYDKNLELVPGRVDEPMPGVRRLLCNNPSPFTFKGTVSYIVGRGKVAIIDPGPDDPVHSAALLDAVRGETVTHIFVTHTHRDHSPGVPAIKAATGALVLAEGPHRAARALHVGDGAAAGILQRHRFQARPRACRRRGGERRGLDARSRDHAGPHRQPHGVRLQGEQRAVLRRSRHGLVDAGGGAAGRLDGRLHGLAAEAAKRTEPIYFPGHGPAVNNAPRFVAAYILHRKAREASILNRLQKGESDIPTLVSAIYANLDPRLLKAAGMSVLAHLEDLVARGAVATDGPASIAGRYRLA